jgi:hypothetical protein
MKNELTTTEAIRARLLRNADELNRKLLARFAEVRNHLSENNPLAALGALEGTETEVKRIRSLLLLMRDDFPMPAENAGKEGKPTNEERSGRDDSGLAALESE